MIVITKEIEIPRSNELEPSLRRGILVAALTEHPRKLVREWHTK